MTKNKDKQIRELKEERIGTISLLLITFGLLIFAIINLANVSKDRYELEQQLQSYQDQVPVWTLKLECWNENYVYPYYYQEGNFTDYDEYLEEKERISKKRGCEVIE